jgi:phosphonopyruvate decarboxylase
MMRRDECLHAIARHRGDRIVVATYQAAFDWLRIAPHPLDYVSIGAMGQASSHALGLALGRPDRQVLVLDGDGSLLMNLGTLVTIATAAPANLLHFVCENGCYEANGSHPIPGQGTVDFAAMARAAGYRDAATFDALAPFETALPGLLGQQGPVMAVLRVVPGAPSPQDYAYIHSDAARERFRKALKDTK